MKVLIVTQHFYPENFRFNDLASELEKDHQVTVLTGIPNYPQGHFYKGYRLFSPLFEEFNGVKVIRSPLIPRGNNKVLLTLNYFSFAIISSLFAIFLAIFKKYDRVLVCQSSPIFMALPAIVYRAFRKSPVVLWITDLWPESLIATNSVKNRFILKFVNAFVVWTYRHVDLILTSCKGFKKSILAKTQATQIDYYPYWSEDFYKPVLPDRNIKLPDDFLLMFGGNFGVAQNLTLLVDAVGELVKDFDFKVVLVGDGRFKQELITYIEEKGLNDSFIFLGSYPPEAMPGIFARADALYLSLRKDPIFEITVPSKLQSYMACGKPIVASIDGEAAQVVKEANCGLTSPANDLTALVESLRVAFSWSEIEKKKLGHRAQIYCKKYFNRAILMEKMSKILESVSKK